MLISLYSISRHAVWIRRLRGLFAAAGDSSDEENEEGADDETAEDTHMLNYFDELLLVSLRALIVSAIPEKGSAI